MSGKMYIPIIHELVCAFLDVSGAENRMTAIPSFTTGDVSIFRQALYKDGAAKITKDLRRHGLLPESVEFLSLSQAGYENGIGMMLAEARMAASEKGYENGIGMMSAEARMAASEKGFENGIRVMSAEARMASRKRATKWASRGRRSTLSSNHTTGCQREEPSYIIGKSISWAMDMLV